MRDRAGWRRQLEEELPTAPSVMFEVELALFLLERMIPGSPAIDAWTLLGGYPFAAAAGRPLPQDYQAMLAVALGEARLGRKEGGIPIGAAIFDATGKLVGAGHNRRVQDGDPSVHAETDAFRKAGRQKSYRKLILATTLAPWSGSSVGSFIRRIRAGTI